MAVKKKKKKRLFFRFLLYLEMDGFMNLYCPCKTEDLFIIFRKLYSLNYTHWLQMAMQINPTTKA